MAASRRRQGTTELGWVCLDVQPGAAEVSAVVYWGPTAVAGRVSR